jgi:hypothetical protein
MIEHKTFKLEDLQEDLLLNLHTKYPNTIDDNAILYVGELGYEKGKAHGCIYSGKVYITNEKKGIRLNFKIWFSVYCAPYGMPDIKPNIDSYLTGKYQKIQSVSYEEPELGLDAVILLNIPEPKTHFDIEPKNRNYFDAYWHTFQTEKGNYILSKEGWFGTYVYDPILGMRDTTSEDFIDLKNGSSQLKEGLGKFIDSDEVREFIKQKYYNGLTPEMFVEL